MADWAGHLHVERKSSQRRPVASLRRSSAPQPLPWRRSRLIRCDSGADPKWMLRRSPDEPPLLLGTSHVTIGWWSHRLSITRSTADQMEMLNSNRLLRVAKSADRPRERAARSRSRRHRRVASSPRRKSVDKSQQVTSLRCVAPPPSTNFPENSCVTRLFKCVT